ncbi:MAG: type II toxin-antitoxin system MqsA family antitoxin [Desulfamplus sp.]|nr:type II toxin-antitoxin system MqsA family antitoxin [Desulfamplus sp.]
MVTKWNGQPCPLCGVGTLNDGVKKIKQEYKGQTFSSETHGAFCNHCGDGFIEFDEAEEAAWLDFRDLVDAAEAVELARNAFASYERGKKRPLTNVINFYGLINRHPELLNELKTG